MTSAQFTVSFRVAPGEAKMLRGKEGLTPT